jgi:hypothetical protein
MKLQMRKKKKGAATTDMKQMKKKKKGAATTDMKLQKLLNKSFKKVMRKAGWFLCSHCMPSPH